MNDDIPNNLFWLASYPKSGNTWFRSFLQALLSDQNKPFNINELSTGSIASSRLWIDNALGFDSADLTHDEVDNVRTSVYQWSSKQAQEYAYHKIHDAYISDTQKKPLFGYSGIAGALYIVRNPLDVCISLANHYNVSIDQAIKIMGEKDYAIGASTHRLADQLRQKMGSWSEHVQGWLSATDIAIKMIRYEDMHGQALQTFMQAAVFLNLPDDSSQVGLAIEACQFEKLQSQEKVTRFKEAPPKTERFFRKGKVGDWQSTLTKQQVQTIIKDHYTVMHKLNYVDDQGKPIV